MSEQSHFAYVVSLRAPGDRVLDNLFEVIRSNGWNPVLVNGIIGRELTAGRYFELIKDYFTRTGRVMTPGEVGCALGHVSAWKTIVAQSNAHAVVLEDDVLVDDQFGERLEALLKRANLLESFVLLGGQEQHQEWLNTIRAKPVDGLRETWEICPADLDRLYMTVGYLISSRTAKRLVLQAERGLFIPDDFSLLYEEQAIESVVLSNIVGHPWGEHASNIEQERAFRRTPGTNNRRPLIKRLVNEICSTLNSRRRQLAERLKYREYIPLAWHSRFRKR